MDRQINVKHEDLKFDFTAYEGIMATSEEKRNSISSKKSYCSTLDTTEYLESVRELPPSNYRFKVESYSKLCEALKRNGIDHFASNPFNAGGCKWMLYVYPSGKKSENGDGNYISLYLKLVDKITGDEVIHATIKIFIYDHLHDQYLSIQDTRVRTFDALNTDWGISQLMDVTTFKDPANGFLFNDGCVFGVEVLVPCENNMRTSLSPVQGFLDIENSYAWKVDNFLNLKADSVSSPVFSLGGHKWKLSMYPRGFKGSKGKSLSLFFGPEDTFGEKIFVELSLKDLKNIVNETTSTWFSEQITEIGFPDFVSLSSLTDPSFGPFNEYCRPLFPPPYKQDDPITIEVKIHVMFLLKDL